MVDRGADRDRARRRGRRRGRRHRRLAADADDAPRLDLGGAEQLGILGLALAAYFGSVAIGGNGFIAAFVGGIVFRAASRNRFVEPTEFTETFGTFLSLLVWAIFGAVLVTTVFRYNTSWRPILYAILSLTVVQDGAGGIGAAGRGPTPRFGQPDGLVRPARAGLGGLHIDSAGKFSGGQPVG